ncbi:transposase family protein [Trichormus azollae]|uniref:transposase family protein n=1 Tax=Trichormus azollae TaxID=1164 RepID=UPI003D346289
MPTFEVLGLHFGISKTEVKDTFHYWLEILGDVLPASVLEQVEKHDRDITIDGVSLNSGQYGTAMSKAFR